MEQQRVQDLGNSISWERKECWRKQSRCERSWGDICASAVSNCQSAEVESTQCCTLTWHLRHFPQSVECKSCPSSSPGEDKKTTGVKPEFGLPCRCLSKRNTQICLYCWHGIKALVKTTSETNTGESTSFNSACVIITSVTFCLNDSSLRVIHRLNWHCDGRHVHEPQRVCVCVCHN